VVNSGYLNENADAVRAFRNGTDPAYDLHDGLEVLELCMASYEAADSGNRVVVQKRDWSGYQPPSAQQEFDGGVTR